MRYMAISFVVVLRLVWPEGEGGGATAGSFARRNEGEELNFGTVVHRASRY